MKKMEMYLSEKEMKNATRFLRLTSADIQERNGLLPGDPLFGHVFETEDGYIVEIFMRNGEQKNEMPHIEAVLRKENGKRISVLPFISGVTNLDGLSIVFPDLYQVTLKAEKNGTYPLFCLPYREYPRLFCLPY